MASKSLIVLLVLLLIGILPRTVSSISIEELDATLSTLRSRGHSLFSNAITTSDVVFDLLSSSSLTFLLPTESSLFALDMTQPASFYVNTLRCHIIPRRLTLRALLRLADGSTLQTLLPSRELRVSRRRVGGVDVIALDGIDVVIPGIYYGRHIAVHGLDGIFSFRSLISGSNPHVPPVAFSPSDGTERLPHNRSVWNAPTPEPDHVEVYSPAVPPADGEFLSPSSLRPENAPRSESPEVSPISESPEISPILESPVMISPNSWSPEISMPSPEILPRSESPPSTEISPSSHHNHSLHRMAPPVFLPENDEPMPPSPSISDKFPESNEDLPTPDMLWDTGILPEISPNSWSVDILTPSPNILPSLESSTTDISPSMHSKFSLRRFPPENDDPASTSPSAGDTFPETNEDLPPTTPGPLSDSEISPNSWSPGILPPSPEISSSSPSELAIGLGPPMLLPDNADLAPLSPWTGDEFPETIKDLPPTPTEFLRDAFRDTGEISAPAKSESSVPPSENLDEPSEGSGGADFGDISPSIGFPSRYPAMKPPLKGEKPTGVEMLAPKQSWPSTGETVECLVTGGDSVSCDLSSVQRDYPTKVQHYAVYHR